jgi:hypothetical protein
MGRMIAAILAAVIAQPPDIVDWAQGRRSTFTGEGVAISYPASWNVRPLADGMAQISRDGRKVVRIRRTDEPVAAFSVFNSTTGTPEQNFLDSGDVERLFLEGNEITGAATIFIGGGERPARFIEYVTPQGTRDCLLAYVHHKGHVVLIDFTGTAPGAEYEAYAPLYLEMIRTVHVPPTGSAATWMVPAIGILVVAASLAVWIARRKHRSRPLLNSGERRRRLNQR